MSLRCESIPCQSLLVICLSNHGYTAYHVNLHKQVSGCPDLTCWTSSWRRFFVLCFVFVATFHWSVLFNSGINKTMHKDGWQCDITTNWSADCHLLSDWHSLRMGLICVCVCVCVCACVQVIQRREDGSVNFFRGWEAYRDGFGKTTGEHWLGVTHPHPHTHTHTHTHTHNIKHSWSSQQQSEQTISWGFIHSCTLSSSTCTDCGQTTDH